MKKLAEKYGIVLILLGIIPGALIFSQVGKLIGLTIEIIVIVQLFLLIIQLFSVVMIVKYNKEIINTLQKNI